MLFSDEAKFIVLVSAVNEMKMMSKEWQVALRRSDSLAFVVPED